VYDLENICEYSLVTFVPLLIFEASSAPVRYCAIRLKRNLE
jgi:hypothetical protein